MASCNCTELACVPAAIAPADRAAHFKLAQQLFQQLVEERVDLPDGYAFRFPAEALELVARFVANERKCCPFLVFELSAAAGEAPLWLRMTGPEGTRAILRAELAFMSLTRSLTLPGRRSPRPTVATEQPLSKPASSAVKLAAAGGVVGALAVIACCILPLTLLSLVIGGAWASRLAALVPYQPVIVAGTAALLAYGHYSVYWKSRRDGTEAKPAGSQTRNRRAKLGLWIATVLAAAGVAFNYIEPLLTGP